MLFVLFFSSLLVPFVSCCFTSLHSTPQALKKKVDSLMAAGKLFVVDHAMLKVGGVGQQRCDRFDHCDYLGKTT